MKLGKGHITRLALLAIVMAGFTWQASAQVGGGIRPGTTTRGTGGGATAGGGRAGGSTREYQNNTTVGDAMITVDPETRQLIIITDDQTNDEILKVVKSLDRPKPQVLIKVVFVQVEHGDDLDFGVEGSYTHKVNGGTGEVGTDFGQIAAQTLAGGGFYQIIGQDVELFVRALQQVGKAEILSRPSILARNNQQATIIVGQEVPFITNTRFDQSGNQINTVQYQDIGIILRVTPFITTDGLVEMIVTPEISALNTRDTVEIQPGVDSPIIDKRSADTVVVTPDGQTVVIGGLIEKRKTDRVRKVPILGDIPILGYAFRRTIKEDVRTELLIFLTPTVIQTPGELSKLAEQTGRSLELMPKALDQKDVDEFLDGIPLRQPAAEGAKDAPKTKP